MVDNLTIRSVSIQIADDSNRSFTRVSYIVNGTDTTFHVVDDGYDGILDSVSIAKDGNTTYYKYQNSEWKKYNGPNSKSTSDSLTPTEINKIDIIKTQYDQIILESLERGREALKLLAGHPNELNSVIRYDAVLGHTATLGWPVPYSGTPKFDKLDDWAKSSDLISDMLNRGFYYMQIADMPGDTPGIEVLEFRFDTANYSFKLYLQNPNVSGPLRFLANTTLELKPAN